jgi:hypothetical protein
MGVGAFLEEGVVAASPAEKDLPGVPAARGQCPYH